MAEALPWFGLALVVLYLLLREIFTANAASPPVETEPATTNATVVKQNGHIVHLLAGEAFEATPPL